jgi:putative transposase
MTIHDKTMRPSRRIHSPEFKIQVALQALSGNQTLAELAEIYEIHPVQVCQWKQHLVKRLPELYRQSNPDSHSEDLVRSKQNLAKLEASNAQLNQELDWLKKNFYNFNQSTLRSVVEPDNLDISLRRQCDLLGITRSGYYYRQRPVSPKMLNTMHLIDEFFQVKDDTGYQSLFNYLQEHNCSVSKRSLHNLLCSMGFAAFERKLMKLFGDDRVRLPPCPLHKDDAEELEEQWILDIAFWPVQNAVRFAALLMDCKSQRCLAWGLSDSLTSKLGIEVLRMGLDKHPLPLILRSESYLPLLNKHFLGLLQRNAISLVPPLWIEQLKGSGRETLLSPLWKALKQEVRGLQKSYPVANDEWLLNQGIQNHFKGA